jgi:hypothetical protein
MDVLLWNLLGYVVYPTWLIVGLADYWTHQRTAIATTSGARESALHLVQAAQIGIPVLIVLFAELNALALAVMALCVAAHTVTAYVDLKVASPRRHVWPAEQMVHAFLITLPLFALAVIFVLHRTALIAADSTAASWHLRWRDPPWPAGMIATILTTSLVFGFLPALAEFTQAVRAERSRARVPTLQSSASSG